MSIPAQNTFPGIKPDLRQGHRRASDIEQHAYAAVGRRFAEGGTGKARRVRQVRNVLAAMAAITVLMLVTLVALLTYENINSPHARKVAGGARGAPPATGQVLAAAARPVVIIDEKDDLPARPLPVPEPVPPLVMLAPAELQASTPSVAARLAAPRKPPRPHDAARRHAASNAGKPVPHALARKGARKGAGKDAPRRRPAGAS